MNHTATTSESTNTLLQVALMLNRDIALSLGCCHSYKGSTSLEDAGLFMKTFGFNPGVVDHSSNLNIVDAILSCKSCVEQVDVEIECYDGFIVVAILGYNLIFSVLAPSRRKSQSLVVR